MKTPLSIILTLFILFMIGLLPKTSAIHPIPLHTLDRNIEHFELVEKNTPIADEKDLKSEKSLTKLILLLTILIILGALKNAYCNLLNLLEGSENCKKFPVGLFMFSTALLVLIRNKFTKRYWRKKNEEKQRRIERKKWLKEDIEADDENDEDDGIIIF